jgi:hypothetical protein
MNSLNKIVLGLVISSIALMAQSGLDIMKKVEARDKGNNTVSNMKMILIDKNGSKRVRDMKSFSKEIGDVSKSMIFFTAPSDVNNTAFLTYDYSDENKDDDQWLYLPALKKTKRIPSSDKSSSFMGSDFTYSDMTDPDLDDYNYKLVKQTKFKGHDVWIIESTPKTQKTIDETGYSKSVVYIRKDILMPVAGKHYLVKGKKVKLFQVHELKKIGGVWFSTKISMITKQGKQTLHKTMLMQNNLKIDNTLKESNFSVRAIEKGL